MTYGKTLNALDGTIFSSEKFDRLFIVSIINLWARNVRTAKLSTGVTQQSGK